MGKIEIIIWDFDGVILFSEEIRQKGFRILFQDYSSEQVDQLMDFHRKNGGLSRYVKIRYFYEVILKISVDDHEVSRLASKFSDIMRKELVNPDLLNEEWLSLMKEIKEGVTHYIASGSDQQELRFLCDRLEIDSYFEGIFGSPKPKIGIVRDILKSNKIAIDQILLIGDSYNDYEAASENKIDFIGYNNDSLNSQGKDYLHSLQDLIRYLNY